MSSILPALQVVIISNNRRIVVLLDVVQLVISPLLIITSLRKILVVGKKLGYTPRSTSSRNHRSKSRNRRHRRSKSKDRHSRRRRRKSIDDSDIIFDHEKSIRCRSHNEINSTTTSKRKSFDDIDIKKRSSSSTSKRRSSDGTTARRGGGERGELGRSLIIQPKRRSLDSLKGSKSTRHLPDTTNNNDRPRIKRGSKSMRHLPINKDDSDSSDEDLVFDSNKETKSSSGRPPTSFIFGTDKDKKKPPSPINGSKPPSSPNKPPSTSRRPATNRIMIGRGLKGVVNQ